MALVISSGFAVWAERLRSAQRVTRLEGRRLASETDGPLSRAGRLAVSDDVWRGPVADRVRLAVRTLERHHFGPLADQLLRLSDTLDRLATEAEHAARLQMGGTLPPAGIDLAAALAPYRMWPGPPPPTGWAEPAAASTRGGVVSMDPARAREVARLLHTAAGELRDAKRRLGRALADLALEPPPVLDGLAAVCDDLAGGIGRRAALMEQADGRAAARLGAAFGGLVAGLRLRPSGPSRSTTTTKRSRSRAGWRKVALRRAGIDPAGWHPTRGVHRNRVTIEKVYDYYGDVYLKHPDLEWLGLAAAAGPYFYAGWLDLDLIRRVADPGKRAQLLSRMLGLPELPEWVYEAGSVAVAPVLKLADVLGEMTSRELDWFLDLFLDMQRQIFMDLAWQHEAFLAGGIVEIRRHGARGTLDVRTVRAWEHIATGDPDRVRAGTMGLIEREQKRVIQDEYDRMRDHHGPVGEAFTDLMTWMADNPIPGGRSYTDVSHRKIGVDLPDLPGPLPDLPDLSIKVPKGNVADYEDRMRWIKKDVAPTYDRFIHRHPDKMREMLETPVSERADGFRKLG